MTGRGRLLPMLTLAILAGCIPDSGDSVRSQDEKKTLAQPAPPLVPVANVVAPPPSNASVLVDDLRPADRQAPLAAADAAHPLDLPPSSDAAPADPFPQEVTAFMVDRDSCDHFRGEEPYDAERRAYLEESIAELCTGTDSRLAVLKQRYGRDREVTAALDQYEERIEAP